MTKWFFTGIAALVGLVPASAGAQSVTTRTVNAHDSDYTTIWASAGARVHIVVVGDGDTDLDLYVYDPRGNLVAHDDDGASFGRDRFGRLELYPADLAEVVFRAPYRGSYRIRVKNLGEVYNRYLLAIRR